MDFIMRKVIVAALALSPMLLHAQANSPAQPKSAATTMQSKLVAPEKFAAVNDNTVPAVKPLRISTGVTAPKLIHSVNVQLARTPFISPTLVNSTVVVSMVVDETGKPNNLKVVKSLGTSLDEDVLAAVSQYRFKPGTLDNEPTPIELTLEITLQKGY
jgi:TonB family protein